MAFLIKKGYAALIGIGQRPGDDAGMAITEDDVTNLRKALVSACGFPQQNITTLSGVAANKQHILVQLDELISKTNQEEAELTLLYFSGHGVVIDREGYLIAHDTVNENIASSGISRTEFAAKLKEIKTKKMVLFLDCCHAGSFSNSQLPIRSADIDVKGTNRVILCASHHSQLSLLSTPVSLFTFALIEGLSGKFLKEDDREVELFALAMYIRERVATLSQSRQQPEIDLLEDGATSNFLLATHPSGYNKAFFKQDFKLWDEHKNLLDLNAPVKIDKAYRKKLIINNGLYIEKQVAKNIYNIKHVENLNAKS